MKKTVMTFFVVLLMGTPVFAAELTVGAMAWYAYWMPPWQEGKGAVPPGFAAAGSPSPVTIRFKVNDFQSDARYPFLGGPIIQIRIHERVSFSAVGLAGKFIYTSSGPSFSFPFLFFNSEYKKTIIKYDADAAINITLLKWLKVFAGCKVQGYQYDERMFYWATSAIGGSINGAGIFYTKTRDRFLNVGPGFGVGFTADLGKDFYLLINFSGLMLFGEERFTYNTRHKGVYFLFSSSGIPANYGRYNTSRFYALGGNGTVSLAYVIPNTKATLSLGLRYQLLRYYHNAGRSEYLNYDGRYDHFMGATVSVTYGFTLGGRTS